MRKFTLVRFTGFLLAGLLSIVAQPLAAEAQSRGVSSAVNFTLPPGVSNARFVTDAQPPLLNMRFIMGGHPDVKIRQIVGDGPGPDFQFPDASPTEVTLFFLDNPINSSPSVAFTITVNITTGRRQNLEVVATWDQ